MVADIYGLLLIVVDIQIPLFWAGDAILITSQVFGSWPAIKIKSKTPSKMTKTPICELQIFKKKL